MPREKKPEVPIVQCPRCGKLVKELISGTCPKCFIDSRQVLRLPKIQITICTECLKYKHGSAWKRGGDDLPSTVVKAVEEQLATKVKTAEYTHLVELRVENPTISKSRASLDIVAEVALTGNEGETTKVCPHHSISLNRVICRVCQLKHSNYFACIIQLRAEERALDTEELDSITELIQGKCCTSRSDAMSYISKIIDRREGRDFYLGSTAMGREFAKEIVSLRGGTIRETKKLVGVEKGTNKNLYKFTILVRLQKLRPGDITEHNRNLCLVLSQAGSKISLKDKNGKTLSLHTGRTEDLPLVAKREDVGEALVLEVRPDGIQILDPRSNSTFDINERPEGVLVGRSVSVIWAGDIPWLVPAIGKEVTG